MNEGLATGPPSKMLLYTAYTTKILPRQLRDEKEHCKFIGAFELAGTQVLELAA